MKVLYPLKLSYITKSPIWSGDCLSRDWNFEADVPDGKIGEAWVLSVREKEMCTVENGEYSGMALSQVLGCKDFPILVKLIDAGDRLSVQVHPDDEYLKTRKTEESHGKTEMWYILDAQPDAEIIYGLADGLSRADFARAVEDNRILPTLNIVKAHPGDVFFIPAGLVHAIGRGILLAEVQQNCDLTYRVYDYGRLGKDGQPRELHKVQAVEVARPFTENEINSIRYSNGNASDGVIADCEFFKVSVIEGERCIESVSADEFVFVLCLDSRGSISWQGKEYPVSRGEGYFLTDIENVSLSGNSRYMTASAKLN